MKYETILYDLVLITLHPSGVDGALASSVLPAEEIQMKAEKEPLTGFEPKSDVMCLES